MKTGFLEKLITRIGRVGPEDIQNYVMRLAEERGFFETVFNTIQEGILVTDAGGRILYLNHAACRFFALDAEEAVGKALEDKIRGLEWADLSGSEQVTSRDMEVFYPENRTLNFYVVPLGSSLEENKKARSRRSDADTAGYAMIVRDITESRRTTQEAIESEKLNALTLLSAGVAHEIGNPLNSLNIHLQLIERRLKKFAPEQREELLEWVRVSKEEIKRLDFIITQFLRAVRPTHPEMRPENVNEVLEEAVSFLTLEVRNRNILVEKHLAPGLPQLQLDRDQMKQAFYNIIRNSFQAMKSGGILHIETGMDPSHVIISFTDTGGGISQENMRKMFEPYFTTKSSGTGLGLLIVRRIVREHGGEIEIQSDEGRGLTLRIRLPHLDRRVRMLGEGTRGENAGDVLEVRP